MEVKGQCTPRPLYTWGKVFRYPLDKRLRSRKPKLTAVGIRCAGHATPSTRKGWHYADKRRSLGRHSSLADYGHGVFFFDRKQDKAQSQTLK
jgi:hypothetical protein